MSGGNKDAQPNPGTSRPPPSAGENVQAAPGTGNPRISTTLRLQLKVLRNCVERMEAEKSELNKVKELLTKSLSDMDIEIEQVMRMKLMAAAAEYFQNREPDRRKYDYDDDDFKDLLRLRH